MFKVGDKVLRIKGDHNGMVEGQTAFVREVSDSGLRLNGEFGNPVFDKNRHGDVTDCWHDDKNFKLDVPKTNVDLSAAVETKYDRTIIGKCGNKAVVDVYRVLDAFEVHNPMLSHLAKKALCAGLRGHKGYMEDLLDIQKAINEAIKLEEQR